MVDWKCVGEAMVNATDEELQLLAVSYTRHLLVKAQEIDSSPLASILFVTMQSIRLQQALKEGVEKAFATIESNEKSGTLKSENN